MDSIGMGSIVGILTMRINNMMKFPNPFDMPNHQVNKVASMFGIQIFQYKSRKATKRAYEPHIYYEYTDVEFCFDSMRRYDSMTVLMDISGWMSISDALDNIVWYGYVNWIKEFMHELLPDTQVKNMCMVENIPTYKPYTEFEQKQVKCTKCNCDKRCGYEKFKQGLEGLLVSLQKQIQEYMDGIV